jgi:hypothetical protein
MSIHWSRILWCDGQPSPHQCKGALVLHPLQQAAIGGVASILQPLASAQQPCCACTCVCRTAATDDGGHVFGCCCSNMMQRTNCGTSSSAFRLVRATGRRSVNCWQPRRVASGLQVSAGRHSARSLQSKEGDGRQWHFVSMYDGGGNMMPAHKRSRPHLCTELACWHNLLNEWRFSL